LDALHLDSAEAERADYFVAVVTAWSRELKHHQTQRLGLSLRSVKSGEKVGLDLAPVSADRHRQNDPLLESVYDQRRELHEDRDALFGPMTVADITAEIKRRHANVDHSTEASSTVPSDSL